MEHRATAALLSLLQFQIIGPTGCVIEASRLERLRTPLELGHDLRAVQSLNKCRIECYALQLTVASDASDCNNGISNNSINVLAR